MPRAGAGDDDDAALADARHVRCSFGRLGPSPYRRARRPRETRAVSSFIFNVTFDCADPRALARFWSAVIGYPIAEERDDFARLAGPRLARRCGTCSSSGFPSRSRRRTACTSTSRRATPEAEVERLLALGATLVDLGDAPQWRTGNGTRWVTMTDPEGNEFCIG